MAKRVDRVSTEALESCKVMREVLALGSEFELAKKRAAGSYAASESSRRVCLRLADLR